MKTKIISLFLALTMLFSVFQITVFAQNNEVISVYFSACGDDNIFIPLQKITVQDGLAEEYGYSVNEKDHNGVTISSVTVFDVLVAVHQKYYGERFTKETAEDYLTLSFGYVGKAFGRSATASGFTVDGKTPHDDVLSPVYGSYTGYSCDASVVNDNQTVGFFFYRDTKYYSDILASFDTFSKNITAGEQITYTLTGYSAAYYGCSSQSVIDENTDVLTGVDVYMSKDNGGFEKIGVTDENGQITVSFNHAGNYLLYAEGTDAETDAPVIATWSIVNVKFSFVQLLKNIASSIMNFFMNVYNYIKNLF